MRKARAVALDALIQIDHDAYANLVTPGLLATASLTTRDRHFVTELVYGTTRMQRACDWLVERHLDRPIEKLDPPVRAALRMGAYQLEFMHTPAHAGVSATVDVAPKRARGLVNAVLRKIATTTAEWPDERTRLSYPDWIVEQLEADLGPATTSAALEAMNQPATVTERPDGYIQDEASQQVAAYVSALPGRLTVDLCAAPGGKATAINGFVVAADVRRHRAELTQQNVRRLGLDGQGKISVVQADGRQPPLREGAADRVLIDAPCTGLGVLRRRPDARWRHQPSDINDLVDLQRALIAGAVPLLAPGGALVYSVCTLTKAETVGVDEWLAQAHPELTPLPPPAESWQRHGRGALLLPQTTGTDGMFLLAVQRPG